MKTVAVFLIVTLTFLTSAAIAQDKDPFRGKLFPPKVVLAEREALELTEEQYADIRAIVVEVQAKVAEHEFDMQDAYARVMALLDADTVDEASVREAVQAVLAAENRVKLEQVAMLVRIRNLLTDGQRRYLETRAK